MTTTARQVLDAAITEKQFLQAVLDLARLHGWRTFHVHDSRRSAAGFPDVVCCLPATPARVGRIVFAELKTMRGRVSAPQRDWLDALARTPYAEVYVWRPCDWEEIVKVLTPTASAFVPVSVPPPAFDCRGDA